VDGNQAATTLKLLDALEDLDDVQAVYTNATFPTEVDAVA
jgi:transcriptional/translational regulatory protein YebC/TACO1